MASRQHLVEAHCSTDVQVAYFLYFPLADRVLSGTTLNACLEGAKGEIPELQSYRLHKRLHLRLRGSPPDNETIVVDHTTTFDDIPESAQLLVSFTAIGCSLCDYQVDIDEHRLFPSDDVITGKAASRSEIQLLTTVENSALEKLYKYLSSTGGNILSSDRKKILPVVKLLESTATQRASLGRTLTEEMVENDARSASIKEMEEKLTTLTNDYDVLTERFEEAALVQTMIDSRLCLEYVMRMWFDAHGCLGGPCPVNVDIYRRWQPNGNPMLDRSGRQMLQVKDMLMHVFGCPHPVSKQLENSMNVQRVTPINIHQWYRQLNEDCHDQELGHSAKKNIVFRVSNNPLNVAIAKIAQQIPNTRVYIWDRQTAKDVQ